MQIIITIILLFITQRSISRKHPCGVSGKWEDGGQCLQGPVLEQKWHIFMAPCVSKFKHAHRYINIQVFIL